MSEQRAFEASDYAGMTAGEYSFYYGYETAIDPECEDDEDKTAWRFQVMKNGEVVFDKTAEQLGLTGRSRWKCSLVVLEGIGAWIEQVQKDRDA